jgi:biopolymer transport protein ExbB/TolQ
MNTSVIVTFFEAVRAGWPMAVPIFVGSILLVALALERFRAFHPTRVSPEGIKLEIQALKKGLLIDQDHLKVQILKHPSLLANVLSKVIELKGRRIDDIRRELEFIGLDQLAELRRMNAWLSYAARIGPLLGLSGSALGLVVSFARIGTETGQQSHIAAGIAAALVATGGGVGLAIVAETLAAYFDDRLDAVAADLARTLNGLPEKLAPCAKQTQSDERHGHVANGKNGSSRATLSVDPPATDSRPEFPPFEGDNFHAFLG